MTNPKLYEALEEEAKDINIEDLMNEMLESFTQEKGCIPTPTDELKVRKMVLARKYIEREIDRLTMLRDAIKAEWDQKIQKKKEEIDGLNGLIEKYIKDANNGKKLSLDVATVSLKRTGPKAVVIDEEKARDFLKQHNQLEKYLKKPALDSTLLQNAYSNDFKNLVAKEAERRIIIEEKSKGPLSKKRKKEIELEVETEWAEKFFSELPDFMQYKPEKKTLSITMK
ncbi:hypothetical protein B14_200084 (plasmid) [Bacillus licheniformis]|uniref:hypothetical protein n=1 Tax=Bacillus subtilis group TaxID=653685 RepID=UPI0009B7B566|nr:MULTISPECIES: hypothetical protein [Bacillus subtilis group]ARC67295.1 hypothetical protein B14_200084 [Bacillus licheniformis]ARW46064.1 hypothetical protein S100141_04844 [Bacillus licheniformis]MCY1628333.1 hypothetical protein [Bacillus paralicheniformis]MDE1421950.1 hypothetical protein [Bacillus licheniformis]MEC0475955.1 hypothetical protein [Bacillus licheniformis]